jgi:hypothetical protein
LPRLLSLAWVAGVRYTVLVGFPSIVIYVLLLETFFDVGLATTIYDVAFYVVVMLAYIGYVGRQFSLVSSSND